MESQRRDVIEVISQAVPTLSWPPAERCLAADTLVG